MRADPDSVGGKITQARLHLRALEAEVAKFLATTPFPLATKRNPDDQRLIYYVESVRQPSSIVSLMSGDVIQNLRSALDHIAHLLVVLGQGQPGPFTYVYFPIGDSLEDYEQRQARYTKRMGANAVKAIDGLRPYKGGNDRLWQLHELNIIDKHRLLLAVGAQVRSVDLGYVMSNMMKLSFGGEKDAPLLSAFFRPAEADCPLHEGEEVFIDAPGAQPLANLPVRFHVALCEPDVLGRTSDSIVETLRSMVDEVEHVSSALAPFLKP